MRRVSGVRERLRGPIRGALRHVDRTGRGLGRLLSEECLARARDDGAERVALHTGEQMVAARRLYERMGLEVLKEIDPRFGFRYWIYTRWP
jgi:ribosomal protein S18 acetylase RimI-like enzyme